MEHSGLQRKTLRLRGPGYPMGLNGLPDAPRFLRVAGQLPELRRAVAIVGTRAADQDAIIYATSLARDLAASGCVVVSGGARGIDAAAHAGALEAEGKTVAVFAGGLDQPFPKSNLGLFQAIRKRGALVSELEDGVRAQRYSFLRRNRLIAALSRAVVVVQAPARSGALSTARVAQELGIPVFAVPAAPWDPRGAGVRALLKAGARVCDKTTDIVDVIAPELASRSGSLFPSSAVLAAHDSGTHSVLSSSPDGGGTAILQALGVRPRHPDELTGVTGLPLEQVLSALLELELDGRVSLRPGGRYSIADGCVS